MTKKTWGILSLFLCTAIPAAFAAFPQFVCTADGLIQVEKLNIDLGKIVFGENTTTNFEIMNGHINALIGTRRFTFIAQPGLGKFLPSDNAKVLLAQQRYTLQLTIPAGTPLGPFRGQLLIEGGNNEDVCSVPFQANVVQPLVISPLQLAFGAVSAPQTRTLSLQANVPIEIKSISAEAPFSVDFLKGFPMAAGTTRQVTVNLNSTSAGTIKRSLKILWSIPPSTTDRQTAITVTAAVSSP